MWQQQIQSGGGRGVVGVGWGGRGAEIMWPFSSGSRRPADRTCRKTCFVLGFPSSVFLLTFQQQTSSKADGSPVQWGSCGEVVHKNDELKSPRQSQWYCHSFNLSFHIQQMIKFTFDDCGPSTHNSFSGHRCWNSFLILQTKNTLANLWWKKKKIEPIRNRIEFFPCACAGGYDHFKVPSFSASVSTTKQ